jgi:undecaprenyl-diphosphatase
MIVVMRRHGWILVLLAAVLAFTTADVLATGTVTRWERHLMLTGGGIKATGPEFWFWRTVVWGGQWWVIGLLTGLLALWTGRRSRRWWPVLVTGLWLVAINVPMYLIKQWTGRPAPSAGYDALYVMGKVSYPSGHTALAAGCWIMMATLLTLERDAETQRKALVAAAAITVLVGLANVRLNYHWPTDVLAGVAYGTIFGLLGRWTLLLNEARLPVRSLS